MKIILALDPATYTTGWAMFKIGNNGKTELIKFGHFDIPKDMKFKQRMFLIREKVLILTKVIKPTHLIIEKPYLGPNVDTFMKLSGGFGIICAVAFEKDLPLIAMPPTEAKIHLLGTSRMKGKESKAKIKVKLEAFYSVKFENCDQSDAVATGITGIDKYIANGIDERY